MAHTGFFIRVLRDGGTWESADVGELSETELDRVFEGMSAEKAIRWARAMIGWAKIFGPNDARPDGTPFAIVNGTVSNTMAIVHENEVEMTRLLARILSTTDGDEIEKLTMRLNGLAHERRLGVVFEQARAGISDAEWKIRMAGDGQLVRDPGASVEVVEAPGDLCGGSRRIDGERGSRPCPGCRACA